MSTDSRWTPPNMVHVVEPECLRFWHGLVIGIVIGAALWAVIAAVAIWVWRIL